MVVLAATDLRLDTNWVDFLLIAIYFVFVLGIGVMARRSVSTSLDFFLSGRSLPAWVTGLAFISANLGAVEIIGMSANGANYGIPTVHYFWVGAVPAMLFLGVVMMPFYYGSKVRSVPEFMRRRFGTGAHLVNALSFALAQLLIAGINLYLLANIVEVILGWRLWISLIVAAAIVLTYTTLGGLSAAIYNEVLQFFVIVAALLPLTIIGLNKVGGWGGLQDKVAASAGGAEQLSSWPGTALTGFSSPFWSVIGIVFGLGFVLSFGYWTTNFVEVQRAMASKSISAAQRAPIIGSFPKMFVPFMVIFPGMIAAVIVTEISKPKNNGGTPDYNNALLYLIRDLLPNGMLGLAIAGLLASFMAGMAANISAFNTVFSYDLWQTYVNEGQGGPLLPDRGPDRDGGGDPDRDRHGHVRGVVHEHHELPADAVRLLQRAAVRHVHPRHVLEADDRDRRLDRTRERHPGGGPGRHRQRGRARHPLAGLAEPVRSGRQLRGGGRGLRGRHPRERRGHDGDHTAQGVRAPRAGLQPDPQAGLPRRERRGAALVAEAEHPGQYRPRHGHRLEPDLLVRREPWQTTPPTPQTNRDKHTAGAFDIRTFIAALMGIYGVILVLAGIFGGARATAGPVDGNPNLIVGISLLLFAGGMQAWAMIRPTVVDEAALARDKAEQEDGPPVH